MEYSICTCGGGRGTKCTGGLEKNLLPSARRQRRMWLIPELLGEKKGAPVNSLRVNRRTITCTLQCIILGEFEGCHWLQRHFLRKDALLGVDSLSWFTCENKKSSSTCQKKSQTQNSYQFYKKFLLALSPSLPIRKRASCAFRGVEEFYNKTNKRAQLFVGERWGK